MRKTTAPQHPEKVFKDFLTAYFKEELKQVKCNKSNPTKNRECAS